MRQQKLKVYGWTALIRERERQQLGLQPWHRQCRAIVAATSLREVGELLGTSHRRLFNLCETGNAQELAVALAKPRAFFAAPLDGPRGYTEVDREAVS
jgi:hypothetical protein